MSKTDITIGLGADGESIAVRLPGNVSGHEIIVPADARAGPLLLKVLQSRQAESASKIGTPADPTQHIIREWLKANPVTRVKLDPDIQELVDEIDDDLLTGLFGEDK